MADKKSASQETPERLYTIPLRGEWLKVPRIQRAGVAATAVRAFLSRHMKAGSVRISGRLNEQLWASGPKRPPAAIRVKARMDGEGAVTAMLPDEVIEKAEEKGKMDRLKERLAGRREGEEKPEEKGKEAPAEGEKSPEEKPAKEGEKPAGAPKEKKMIYMQPGESAKKPKEEKSKPPEKKGD